MKLKSPIRLFFSLLVLLVFSACALKKRTQQEIPATFLEDVDRTTHKDNLPFDHSWLRQAPAGSEFNSTYFKPIRLDLLPKDEWQRSRSTSLRSEQAYLEKAREISEYFRSQLIEKTSDLHRSNRKFVVTENPGPTTLIIEIAFTELELSHPVARTGALLSPVPGTGPALAAVSDPHVAFAARLTSGRTGELIATVADRKFAPARIVDFNKLTVSSSAREICAIWAETLAEAIQSEGLTTIKEKRFDLMPW